MKLAKLIAFALFFLSFLGCTPKSINIEEINSVKINSISKSILDLDLEMRINNPNTYAIKLISADLDLKINKVDLGRITEIQEFEVPRKSNQLHTLNVKIELKGFATSSIALLTTLVKKEVTVVMKGEIVAKAGILKKKIEIDQRDVVSLRN